MKIELETKFNIGDVVYGIKMECRKGGETRKEEILFKDTEIDGNYFPHYIEPKIGSYRIIDITFYLKEGKIKEKEYITHKEDGATEEVLLEAVKAGIPPPLFVMDGFNYFFKPDFIFSEKEKAEQYARDLSLEIKNKIDIFYTAVMDLYEIKKKISNF